MLQDPILIHPSTIFQMFVLVQAQTYFSSYKHLYPDVGLLLKRYLLYFSSDRCQTLQS